MTDLAGAGTARFRLDPDHPCFAGHFPGRPLVPGVLLLDALLAALGAALGAGPALIETARFAAPVAPGETVELAWIPRGSGRIGFEGKAGGRRVLSGTIRPLA